MPSKKGGRRKKKKQKSQHALPSDAAQSALTTKREELKVPKSLVIRRGKTASEVAELVDNLRHVMLPYTALKFEEDPKNRKLTLHQYATHLALPMGITHILSFSQNQERLNLRLARLPEGPTLSFRVHRFSLNRQIKALQKRPVSDSPSLHANPPIVVTNNFGSTGMSGGEGNTNVAPHIKLLRITFQNLFPAINVSTVKLSDCRRVVLFNLLHEEVEEEVVESNNDHDDTKNNNHDDDDDDDDDDGAPKNIEDQNGKNPNSKTSHPKTFQKKIKQIVEMRHYAIKATPVGVHRRVRRLVQAKLPNLHKCQDISDYLSGAIIQSDAPSDSEAEDDPNHIVQLPDHYVGKGNAKDRKSALKLVELGPRLSMELIKVEKGLGSGDVLYHALVQKSPQEAAALKARKEQERLEKEQRKAQQEANVERKRKALEEKRETKRKRKEEREQAIMESLKQQVEDDDDDDTSSKDLEEKNVGQEDIDGIPSDDDDDDESKGGE